MMILAIAAIMGRKIGTVDITGAYLECNIPEEDEVIMTLDPVLAGILAQIDPSVEQMADDKGVVYVRLKKALYGCVQSAKLWYDKLSRVLGSNRYVKNDYDPCLFNKTVDGVQVTVAFHVDNLLITSMKDSMIDEVEAMLKRKFTAITVNRSDTHSYLSMDMVVDEHGVHLDMIAHIDKCVKLRVVQRPATSPATEDLFEVPEDSEPLKEAARKDFHSDLAKLLYLSGRVSVAATDD
jgi:hypothetical protein